MKKINSFKIISLSVSGFKCFEEKVTFDFGDMTYITAANGLGKSSIADAIAFAFTGTPFYGDRGLDRLLNRNMRKMTVSVDFTDDTGTTHNITRTRKRDATSISYDGLNVRQTDINTVFGDKEIFLSIFNPLYFIDILGDNGKGLLEKLLPVVSHEDVLNALPASSREILEKEHLSSPETYIKNRRVELGQFEKSLIGYKSQQELLEYQRKERTDNLKGLRFALDTVQVEITDLMTLRDKGRDLKAEQETLTELHRQRDELFSDYVHGDANKAMLDITNEIRSLESSITEQTAKPYVSQYSMRINKSEAGLQALYAEHKKISDNISRIVTDYRCPTCKTLMTDTEANDVKVELQQKLSVIVSGGKETKGLLSGLRNQDESALCEFETHKAEALMAAQSRLSELTQRLHDLRVSNELDAQTYNERLGSLNNQISLLEHQISYGNLSPEQARQLSDLENTKREYEAKIDVLNNIAGSDYDYIKLIEETEADITRLKRIVSEAIQYAAKRAELMFAGLKMNRAEIVLSEVVKTTGEIKDCFRFSYDGCDYRCLSLSERIKAGLEVSELIKRLPDRNYPVFVDNGESICTIDNIKPSGQVIFSRVVKGQSLQVTSKNNEELRKAG